MNIRVEIGSLNKSQITGVGFYTQRLVHALRSTKGITVATFLMRSDQDFINEVEYSARHKLHHSQKLYRKLHQLYLSRPFDKKLPPADVTIFPDFALWPTRRSKLNAVVIHDLTFIKYPEYMRTRKIGTLRLPVTSWYLSSVVRRAAKEADFVITVSNSIKQDMVSLLNVDQKKIIVTPIPPSDDFISLKNSVIDKQTLCKKYAISTNDYILSVGTIEPRKNQIATLRAYLKLPDEIRLSHSLVFAGGYGWGYDDFLREVNDAIDMGENIILTGYFDFNDSYSLYQHAALFTSASHYEGFGMPLLEAMIAHAPLLVADIPVYREVAQNAALYTTVNDSDIYADDIIRLLNDRRLRKQLDGHGLKQKNDYSWEQNTTTLIQHFNTSLSKLKS